MNKRKLFVIIAATVMIMTLVVTFVACNELEDAFGAPANVKYDGNYIMWDATEAEYYNISINNGTPQRVDSTTFAYKSSENFEVKITAVYEKYEKETIVTFKPLATVAEIYVSNSGEISWDAVSGAVSYLITVNGVESTINDTFYNKLPSGANRIKVKPIVPNDNSFYSLWSAEKKVNICATPTNLKYENNIISWVGSANSYEVFIDGESHKTIEENAIEYTSSNIDFVVSVKALGDHVLTYDSPLVTEEYHYLDKITQLKIVDGNLQWNPIDGAKGYRIKVDGIIQTVPVSGTIYDKLNAGVSQKLEVMPYNEEGNYFSEWSPSITAFLLKAPVLKWDDSIALTGNKASNTSWDPVPGAKGYTVKLTKGGASVNLTNGDIVGNTSTSWEYDFLDVAEYVIEIKANGDEAGGYFDSKYSNPIKVERLAAPTRKEVDFITSDANRLSAGFTVNFNKAKNATGYKLYRGENEEVADTTSSSFTDTSFVSASVITDIPYNYYIRSIGDSKTVQGIKTVTLNSLEELRFDIKILPTPRNVTISGFSLVWDDNADITNYTVRYAGETVSVAVSNLELETLLKSGSYMIDVCAQGDGAQVLASNYSDALSVVRLRTPTNIRITSDNNGTIGYDEVPHAKSYEVFTGKEEKKPVDKSQFTNMNDLVLTTGTYVNVRAYCNEWIDNTYYMSSLISETSEAFVRLEAPKFDAHIVDRKNLSWRISNVESKDFIPTYALMDIGKGTTISSGETSTQYEIISYTEKFGAGTYEFQVKAVGNGTKFIDSAFSDTKTITVPKTPELEIKNNKYFWRAVAGASSYYLEIDGNKAVTELHRPGAEYEYAPNFTSIGKHTVKLWAVGDGYESIDSNVCEIQQEVKQLSSPKFSYAYSHIEASHDGKINVTIDTPIENATGYKITIGGVEQITDKTTYSYSVGTDGATYSIKVAAKGGAFDSEGIYYIDSLTVGDSSVDRIIILPKIVSTTLNKQADGYIDWKTPSLYYGDGYEYQLSFDNGQTWSEIIKTSEPRTNEIENINSIARITIKVRACGSADGKVISGEWLIWSK